MPNGPGSEECLNHPVRAEQKPAEACSIVRASFKASACRKEGRLGCRTQMTRQRCPAMVATGHLGAPNVTRGPADKCSPRLIVAARPFVARALCVFVSCLLAFCLRAGTGSRAQRHGCLRGPACVSDCAYARRIRPPVSANEPPDMPRASPAAFIRLDFC